MRAPALARTNADPARSTAGPCSGSSLAGDRRARSCGPLNCDEPLGPCDDENPADCDLELVCDQAETCIGNVLYPTGCGATNCDEPIGVCDPDPAECDPGLPCGDAFSCIDGAMYPTTCGPLNCDEPLGDC